MASYLNSERLFFCPNLYIVTHKFEFMRNTFVFLVVAGAFLSCSKRTSIDSTAIDFVGRWQYQYQSGGQTGLKVYQQSGKITTLNFNSDKTYQRLSDNNTPQEGVYAVKAVKSIFTGNDDNGISFDSSNSWKIITVRKDTLSLSDNFPDGFSQVYLKVK